MYKDDDGPAEITLEAARAIRERPLVYDAEKVAPAVRALEALYARMPRVGDPWVDRIAIMDPWKLHALGVTALYWNSCESNLITLLAVVQRREPEDVRLNAEKHDTTWQFRQVLKHAEERGLSPHVLSLLDAARAAFDSCRLNRNALLHAGLEQRRGQIELGLNYRERKSSVGRSLQDDLTTIRNVADDIRRLNGDLSSLWRAMLGNKATVEVMLYDEKPILDPGRI